ncbi:MAG: TVP38/TMEM64 family protein [Geminicoccaceae bacterium]
MTLPAEGAAKRPSWKRYLPLAVLVLAIALVFAFDLQRFLTFDALRDHRAWLEEIVGSRPVLAGAVFFLVYAVATALSVPGAVILTIAGGFLFGTWIGGMLAVAGATLGAVLVFLIARTSLGESLKERAGPWLARMEAGFAENAMSYLLVLRLVPLFPFWLVNLVPAFLGVKLSTYTIATFIGIIPGGLVYASVGNGLGAVFDRGEEPDLQIFLKPEILVPILGLTALALVPVIHRHWKGRGGKVS